MAIIEVNQLKLADKHIWWLISIFGENLTASQIECQRAIATCVTAIEMTKACSKLEDFQ